MTDTPYDKAGTSDARRLLQESETALWDVLAAINLMRNRITAGETLPPAELQRAVLALGTTRAKVLDEVQRHERRKFLENGLVADAPLDFEAIRDEIRSEIDRLRAAEDAGAFSDRPVD